MRTTVRRAHALVVVVGVASCGAPAEGVDAELGSVEQPIYGGQATSAYPAVGQVASADNGTVCTGTLISPRAVLTAAHCFQLETISLPNHAIVSTGYIHVVEDGWGGWGHPSYRRGESAYDQRILALKKPVLDVSPMSIHPHLVPFNGVGGFTAIGYGDPYPNARKSCTVQGGYPYLGANIIGVSWETGMPGSGDSGGPLIRMDIVHGVDSAAAAGSSPPTFAYYSGVDPDWITNFVKERDGEPIISATSWGAGRLNVFGRNGYGHLVFKAYDAGWSPTHETWYDMTDYLGAIPGERMLGTPEVVSWGPNRIDIFVRDKDRNPYHGHWDGARWVGWSGLGVFPTTQGIGGHISAASWGPERIDIAAIGSDGKAYHKYYANRTWGPRTTGIGQYWESIGDGPFMGDIKIVSGANGFLDIFAVGQDEHLYHKGYFPGIGWLPSTGFDLVDGSFAVRGTITATRVDNNVVEVFAKDTNNTVHWAEYRTVLRAWPAVGTGTAPGLYLAGLSATSSGTGTADLLGQGLGHDLWQVKCYAQTHTCSDPVWIGGQMTGPPAVVSWGPGRLDVFVPGRYDMNVHHIGYQSGWGPWDSLQGPLTW